MYYSFDKLKDDRDIWKSLDEIPATCSWCNKKFEIKYGTLYNIIRRDADGIYCTRKCSGAARASYTQKKYEQEGGKACKRCGEFKVLSNFSKLPNPPYYRAECKRCHNFKPARRYNLVKDSAMRSGLEFNLTMDQYLSFLKDNCFYCNSKVKTIRLELIDEYLGYKIENLVLCCKTCKKFKNNINHNDFIKLCQIISDNVRGNNE